jgi:hypothetical protein
LRTTPTTQPVLAEIVDGQPASAAMAVSLDDRGNERARRADASSVDAMAS